MDPLQFQTHTLLYREEFEITHGHQPQNALIIPVNGRFFCSFYTSDPFVAFPGDFVFFPIKREFNRYILAPCSMHLIYFTLNEDHPLCSCLPQGKVDFQDKARQMSNMSYFQELLNHNDDIAGTIKQHVLNDIFLQYCYETSPPNYPENQLSVSVQTVIQFFIKHLGSTITLAEVANIAGLSPTGLIRRFRLETGYTPIEYLLRLRLHTAEDKLLNSTKSISAIADECGYSNIYYFSNAFKKMYGCSPMEYRRNAPRV